MHRHPFGIFTAAAIAYMTQVYTQFRPWIRTADKPNGALGDNSTCFFVKTTIVMKYLGMSLKPPRGKSPPAFPAPLELVRGNYCGNFRGSYCRVRNVPEVLNGKIARVPLRRCCCCRRWGVCRGKTCTEKKKEKRFAYIWNHKHHIAHRINTKLGATRVEAQDDVTSGEKHWNGRKTVSQTRAPFSSSIGQFLFTHHVLLRFIN